ncbi:DUF192 domain-containing protein [Planktotalea sp.]|uniref:DUF192 domain-containing protein n=1 Tax=Planktotalea sp. TaxID=2029877 RepID=UPI003C7383F4
MILLGIVPTGMFAQPCSDGNVLVKGSFGEARFTVELADEPAERSQGLMHREVMAASAGMLFVFEKPQPVAFWMKNTLIPLDMVFADRTGKILRIHENAIPHDETPIPGGDAVYAVLEINAGLTEKFGFRVGDALQHPAFSGGPAIIKCVP